MLGLGDAGLYESGRARSAVRRVPRQMRTATVPPGRGDLGSFPEHRHHPHHRERSVASDNEGAEYRIEHDSMGEVRVPAWAKWRGETPPARRELPLPRTPNPA